MNPNVTRWHDEAEEAVRKVESKTAIRIPVALVLGVIEAESTGNPEAVSHCGARGLMQLMPATAKMLGVNARDPKQNIYGGTLYLAKLRKQFPENWKLVVAAYNAGPGNVRKHGGIPPFKETQNYVMKVFRFMNQYD